MTETMVKKNKKMKHYQIRPSMKAKRGEREERAIHCITDDLSMYMDERECVEQTSRQAALLTYLVVIVIT